MKFFALALTTLFTSFGAFAADFPRVQDPTVVTCDELNEHLAAEKGLVLGHCQSDVVVSKQVAGALKADKACPAVRGGIASYQAFYTQSKDVLKCTLGMKCVYSVRNPPVPRDPPGF